MPVSRTQKLAAGGATVAVLAALGLVVTLPADATTKPGVPRSLTASPVSASSERLDWQAPSSAGTKSITRYDVRDVASGSTTHTTKPSTRTYTATKLAAKSYTYEVRAVSSAGSGAWAKVTFTPGGTTPTPTPTPTPTETPTDTPTPTDSPTSTPVSNTDGIWISHAKLMSLPTSGAAWDRMLAVANSTWDAPDLSDNNALGDTQTLAGAYVAARTGDAKMRAKVVTQLEKVHNSGYARVLELSRNITSFVISADLIDYHDPAFETFVGSLRIKPLSGHSGGTNLRTTARLSPNNWGEMSRAAESAIDLYLGDDPTDLQFVANTHREWLGEDVPGFTNTLKYTSTNWHTDSPKHGINKVGASRDGHSLDGVLPEDQRRTGEYTWPAPKGSYPWEALQGAVVTAELLDHAGLVPFSAGNNAMLRAPEWLTYVNNNPAQGDDTYQPWIYNSHGGNFATSPAQQGKNMAWTDWAFQPVK